MKKEKDEIDEIDLVVESDDIDLKVEAEEDDDIDFIDPPKEEGLAPKELDDLTPKQLRKHLRVIKKQNRVRIKAIKAEMKILKADKKKGKYCKDYRRLEDELLDLKRSIPSSQRDEELSSGKDMFTFVEETFGDDISKLPPKLKVLIDKGLKWRELLDRAEKKFALRFHRTYTDAMKECYGKQYKDQDYGQIYSAFLDL